MLDIIFEVIFDENSGIRRKLSLNHTCFKKRLGYVRSVDIATELGFSKPSISRAMGILKEAGYIIVEPTGNIVLTDMGMDKAEQVYERHIVITKYLERVLGVSSKVAESDACRIEHIISEESFSKIKSVVDSLSRKT